jgi:hypothetical protein
MSWAWCPGKYTQSYKKSHIGHMGQYLSREVIEEDTLVLLKIFMVPENKNVLPRSILL